MHVFETISKRCSCILMHLIATRWLKHLFALADVGFEIPNRFVVGYALDYNEYFRDLNVSPEFAAAANLVTFWKAVEKKRWKRRRWESKHGKSKRFSPPLWNLNSPNRYPPWLRRFYMQLQRFIRVVCESTFVWKTETSRESLLYYLRTIWFLPSILVAWTSITGKTRSSL